VDSDIKEIQRIKNYLLFRLSLCSLVFISPISLIGFFIFSINNTFARNIYSNISFNSLTYPCILVTCFIFLSSCIGADNKLEAFIVSLNFIPFFLLFLAVANTFNTYKFKQVLICILVTSIPVIFFAIIEFAFNQYGYYNTSRLISQDSQIRYPRSTSVFDNSNGLASYLVILLAISLGIFIEHTKRYIYNPNLLANLYNNKVLFLTKTYICFNILAIGCAQSRNGFLVASIVMIFASTLILKFKDLYFLICLLIIATVCFYSLKNITLMRHLGGELSLTSSMAREILTFATDSRTKIWEIAISLGKQRPFLGWGLGNYKLLYPVQSIGTPPHPHNLWLMLFAETGLMGTVSLNIFVGHILCQSVRRIHLIEKEKQSILIIFLMAFSASVMFHFFDCPLFDARINCLNWIFLAGIFSLSSRASPHNTALEPTSQK